MGTLYQPKNRKEVNRLVDGVTRRGFLGGGLALGALAMAAGLNRPGVSANEALANIGILPDDLPAKKYKAAFSELGAASTWVAHGIATTQFFGALLGVEIESFDGQLSTEKQLQDMQTIATGKYDFVAVHPSASDALVDPASEIIGNGIPLVDMDTRLVQDEAAFAKYGHLTFIEPDNVRMGETIAKELFDAIGGEGQVIHTQGALSHTGAQGRAQGFRNILKQYPKIEVVDETPGDWKADKVASLWQDLLQRYPNVKGGFFHSDDMALAAQSVIEAAGMKDQVKIVGVDGQRNACEAILADKMLASVINPSGRIHGGAVWAGYLKVSGTDQYKKDYGEFPKFIRADGGPITKDNAAGYIWLGDNNLY
ncbi:MAG TPA: sugar ABC transporter substrate-binding protein [Thermomicrobiales bacterium]|nr:sugar ABC transporter substrate-binding protein [Thermomicrobiales bacterium]